MIGVEERDTASGIHVVRLSYTANPEKRTPEWEAETRRGLSQGAWQREYEINWTVATGLPVLADFKRDWHVARASLQADAALPLYRCWDFGLTPACVFFQIAPTTQVRVLHEMVTWDGRGEMRQQGIEQFAPGVVLETNLLFGGCRLGDYADPAGWSKSQSDAKSCVEIMRAALIYPIPGPVTFTRRRAALQDLLDRAVAGEPAVLISPECRMLIEGFHGAYRYQEIGETGRFRQEVDKNAWSHPMDAFSYGVAALFVAHREGSQRIRRRRRETDPVTGY